MPKAAINNFRILAIGLLTLALDQITKWIVVQKIPGPAQGSDEPIVVIDGFFELVHYGNTGAAWSIFSGNNFWLAIFSMVALVFLWVCRRHFGVETTLGQVALGLMLGGVAGNLIDRLYEPAAFLREIVSRMVPGGLLVITSPYTWLEDYTPVDRWLGGRPDGGKTLDGMRQVLADSCDLVGCEDIPFVIRETARKHQHTVAEASFWRKH